MTNIDYTLNYPESELNLKFEIERLNNRWKNHLGSITGEKILSEIFVSDGFYPYYYDAESKNVIHWEGGIGNRGNELSRGFIWRIFG